MFDFIARPMGKFLFYIYNTIAFESYGWSIIIFTVIVKLILLPLTIKQVKATAKIQELQPQIIELQRKYKNDKEKYNQELIKFYSENNYNPASGCLPLLIQLPIIFSLLWVISKPLTYMFGMTQDKINELKQAYGLLKATGYVEIDIINKAVEKGEKLLNMDFLGINLGMVPSSALSFQRLFNSPNALQYWGLLLIPVIAVIATYFSQKLTMVSSGPNDSSAAFQKNMMIIGPLMTLIFSFQFPAGLGIYWIVGYVFQIFQQLFINKYVLKKKGVANK